MARYSDTLDDQYGRPIGGALVYVTDSASGALASLTDDSAVAISNPIITPATGAVSFNVSPGIYDFAYWFGARMIREDFGVSIGGASSLPVGSVVNSLSPGSTSLAPSQAAVLAILSGTVPFNLPDEALGQAVPASGSKLPYLSGGVLKIA